MSFDPSTALHQRPDKPAIEPLMRLIDEPKSCAFSAQLISSAAPSSSLKSLSEEYSGKAEIIEGPLSDVLQTINSKGYKNLYIDGGITVQNFLKEDLIDEMIITVIPILLGGGTPLFAVLPKQMEFECIKSEVLLNAMVQTRYRRKK